MTFRYLPRRLWNRSITRNMLFSYLGINLMLLYLLGVVSIRDSSSTLADEVTASRYKVMEQAARGFDFNLEEAKRPLIQFAAHNSVVTLLNHWPTMTVEERIRHERSVAELSGGVTSLQSLISDIFMLGTNGYVNNLDQRKSLQWDYPFREQPWFLKAVSSDDGKGFIPLNLHRQDYYLASNLSRYKQPTFSIAIPVKGYGQQVIGAIVANLDLQKVNGLFELNAGMEGESIFMIDDERTVVVHQDRGRIGSGLEFEGIDRLFADESGSFTAVIDGAEQLVIFHPTSVEGLRLVSTIPMAEIRAQSDPLRANLAGMLYLCLILNTLLSVMITLRISRPFGRLLMQIDKLGEASLYVVPKNYKYRELNLIGDKFKELVGRIEQLVKQNYVSEIALRDAHLKALQAQINPHFLFNTLQLLQTEIVCGNTDDSNQLVLALSQQLRYSMRGAEELVELGAELRNAKHYLFIMNKKFDGRLDVVVDVADPALLRCRTVKLLLQPIVENAIVHGFREQPREARIHIRASAARGGMLIAVADNGAGMPPEARNRLNGLLREPEGASSRIGLRNVHQRIRLKFGPEYGIRIRSLAGRGTAVFILLPAQREPGALDVPEERKGSEAG